jgi:membrane protein insertase Oxa1/YidC/SpoIIIJ
MLPSIKEGEKLAEKTPDNTDDMAYMMQQQSAYMMPLMNVVIGITLPAGTMLYLVVSTIFTIVQNYFIYGLGELKPYVKKIKSVINTTNE